MPVRSNLDAVDVISTPNNLTLVLVAEKGGEDHYAVVPFPQTYEDAIAAATKYLGRYMLDRQTVDIILRCSAINREGKWIWADIPPENWTTTLTSNPMEVGVFQLQKRLVKAESLQVAPFLRGTMIFTYHVEPGGNKNTTWETSRPNSLSIDRPENFTDAVNLVKQRPELIYDIRTGYNTLNFCFFPNNNFGSWILFPSEAYINEAVWQAVVPPPGKILGVILRKGPVGNMDRTL